MKKEIVYLIAGLVLGVGITFLIMHSNCSSIEKTCKQHECCSSETKDTLQKSVLSPVEWGVAREYILRSPADDIALKNLKSGYPKVGENMKLESWFLRRDDLFSLVADSYKEAALTKCSFEGLRFYPVLMPATEKMAEHHSLVIVGAGKEVNGDTIDIKTANVQEFLEPCPNQCPKKKITDKPEPK